MKLNPINYLCQAIALSIVRPSKKELKEYYKYHDALNVERVENE